MDLVSIAEMVVKFSAAAIQAALAAKEAIAAKDEAAALVLLNDALKTTGETVAGLNAALDEVLAASKAEIHDKFDHEPATNPIIKQP